MLSDDGISAFHDEGFLFLEGAFTGTELAVLRAGVQDAFDSDGPHCTYEAGSGVVRGVHGIHETHAVFATLARLPRLVEPARQLLDDQVYIHQFKINAKRALVGEVWEWHQDFRFWRDEDGMPSPNAVTVAIFIEEVNEFNGPLMLVPGSHQDGVYETEVRKGTNWGDTLSSALKYTMSAGTLADALGSRDIVAPKGEAGSVLFFHSNVLHGSAPNLSPVDRTLVLITYNAVGNRLGNVTNPRPAFLANRDFSPLATVDENSLHADLTGWTVQ
jgi:hypothetical protein